MRLPLLSLVLGSSLLPGQTPVAPAAKPHSLPPAAAATLAPGFGPLFDTAADGTVWAAGLDYKVAFAAGGPEFHPLTGEAPACPPLRLSLAGMRLAGEPWPVAAPTRHRDGSLVVYDHGIVRQCYQVGARGIEQSFHFAALPHRGALELRIAVPADLAATADDSGLRFTGEHGGVHYGTAIAFDAKGERTAVTTELRDGAIVLSVPAAFVATATLPLVVDPMVTAQQTVHTNPRLVTSKDILWLDSQNEYWICFERQFTATDIDVYVQRCDPNLQPLGSALVIDISTTSWRQARMAGLDAHNRALVVAEVSTAHAAPFKIGGRIATGGVTPAVLPAFDIQNAALVGHNATQATHPDVGGDPGFAADRWFVAWESTFSPNDHDILARSVGHDGTLLGSWLPLDVAQSFEHDPQVSKSNGSGWISSKFWGVAFQRDFSGGQSRLRVAMVASNGVARNFGNQLAFDATPLTTTTPGGFTISSPTDPDAASPTPSGTYLLADTITNAQTQSPQLRGTLVDATGVTLVAQQTITGPGHDSPRIACDGARFVLAARSIFSPTDDDVTVVTLARNNGLLHPIEQAFPAATTDRELGACITSPMEGGRQSPTLRFAGAWNHLLGASTTLEAALYDGMAPSGGFLVRPTGCGGLQITTAGTAAIGAGFAIGLPNASGLAGFVFGAPVNVPLPICPGCTQGASGDTLLTTGFGSSLPMQPNLIGVTIAFQGFDFGIGPCLGQLRLSDTADMTIR